MAEREGFCPLRRDGARLPSSAKLLSRLASEDKLRLPSLTAGRSFRTYLPDRQAGGLFLAIRSAFARFNSLTSYAEEIHCRNSWRRGRDLNPRYRVKRHNGLASRRTKPGYATSPNFRRKFNPEAMLEMRRIGAFLIAEGP